MKALSLIFLLAIWLPVHSYTKDVQSESTFYHSAKSKRATSGDNLIHQSMCREKRAAARGRGRVRISTVRASSTFPFMAAARLDTNCSAVVVTDRHVMTAAHCLVSRDRGILKDVRVGFLTTTGTLRWMAVKRVWHPEEWKKQDGQPPASLDYALLVLKSKHRRPALRPFLVMNQTSFTRSNGSMHVLAFDYLHRPEQLLYRMCKADETRDGLVYSNECSANEPASGAGIYTQFYDLENEKWRRVLVGILRGNSRSQAKERQRMETVWITREVMDKLCEWTKKTRYKLCDDVE